MPKWARWVRMQWGATTGGLGSGDGICRAGRVRLLPRSVGLEGWSRPVGSGGRRRRQPMVRLPESLGDRSVSLGIFGLLLANGDSNDGGARTGSDLHNEGKLLGIGLWPKVVTAAKKYQQSQQLLSSFCWPMGLVSYNGSTLRRRISGGMSSQCSELHVGYHSFSWGGPDRPKKILKSRRKNLQNLRNIKLWSPTGSDGGFAGVNGAKAARRTPAKQWLRRGGKGTPLFSPLSSPCSSPFQIGRLLPAPSLDRRLFLSVPPFGFFRKRVGGYL